MTWKMKRKSQENVLIGNCQKEEGNGQPLHTVERRAGVMPIRCYLNPTQSEVMRTKETGVGNEVSFMSQQLHFWVYNQEN